MPARDWALIRKYLINVSYNPKINNYFTSPNDVELKNLCLIQSNDSALIADQRMNLCLGLMTVDASLVDVSVRTFDSCNGTSPVWKQRTVSCLRGTESETVLKFEYLADLKGQQVCNSQCYAAVPEWWQIRLEGKRPQLVILFAETDINGKVIGSPKNPITIPHPVISRGTTSPLPPYQKGQYESMLTLNDNSKIILNAVDASTADSMMDACKALVDPKYLQGSIQRPTAPRRGTELLQIRVKAVRGEYFATGMENTKPDWIDIYT